MNFLKSYVGAISEFVSSVVGESEQEGIEEEQQSAVPNPQSNDPVQLGEKNNSTESVPSGKETTRSGLLDWVPKLQKPAGENAVVYYMNRLASLGGENIADLKEPDSTSEKPASVITSDVPTIDTPPSDVSGEVEDPSTSDKVAGNSQMEEALFDWLNGLSARTGEVWSQMMQDFGEVVSVVSKEKRDTVTRTASSLRQHMTALADAALKIDPNEFALLPESTASSADRNSCLAPEDKVAAPPALSELPLLSSLRLDVSDLLSGFMTSLFGSNDLQQPAVIRGRREARLQIIRADPATYECEPSPPPPHLSVHSYADWRSAYFDEVTCQPRPGIPLCETRDPKNEHQSPNSLLEPPHPSPEELLDQYPFMRTYLTQLVQVEGQPGGKGLTDADFWSRYYYRVWLLDVTERRRQKLAERVASTTTVTATDVTGSTERPAQTGNKLDGTDGNVDNDWLDSDTDHSESQTVSTVNNRTPTTWIPLITEAQCTPSEQIDSEHKLVSLHTDALIRTTKPAGKPRKRRAKKRSGATAHETGREESDSESPIHPVAAKTSPSVIQNTITAPKQEQPEQLVQATCDTMLSLGARAENRLIGEPDDMFTSGSSSVVVLSHSEDESELPSSDPQKSSPHQMNSVGTVASNLANVNLGDWGETSDDERSQSSNGKNAPRTPSATEKHVEPSLNDETDDWENWS